MFEKNKLIILFIIITADIAQAANNIGILISPASSSFMPAAPYQSSFISKKLSQKRLYMADVEEIFQVALTPDNVAASLPADEDEKTAALLKILTGVSSKLWQKKWKEKRKDLAEQLLHVCALVGFNGWDKIPEAVLKRNGAICDRVIDALSVARDAKGLRVIAQICRNRMICDSRKVAQVEKCMLGSPDTDIYSLPISDIDSIGLFEQYIGARCYTAPEELSNDQFKKVCARLTQEQASEIAERLLHTYAFNNALWHVVVKGYEQILFAGDGYFESKLRSEVEEKRSRIHRWADAFGIDHGRLELSVGDAYEAISAAFIGLEQVTESQKNIALDAFRCMHLKREAYPGRSPLFAHVLKKLKDLGVRVREPLNPNSVYGSGETLFSAHLLTYNVGWPGGCKLITQLCQLPSLMVFVQELGKFQNSPEFKQWFAMNRERLQKVTGSDRMRLLVQSGHNQIRQQSTLFELLLPSLSSCSSKS